MADNPKVNREHSASGVLIVEEHLEDGQRHGAYTAWWENGKLREQGRYYRGVRVGLYRWYGETGMLLKEEDYGPGVLS
jgi:antitoxin component YwqK of YwqJK toxin-antitoxin module